MQIHAGELKHASEKSITCQLSFIIHLYKNSDSIILTVISLANISARLF